jgi:hypothetical protein
LRKAGYKGNLNSAFDTLQITKYESILAKVSYSEAIEIQQWGAHDDL